MRNIVEDRERQAWITRLVTRIGGILLEIDCPANVSNVTPPSPTRFERASEFEVVTIRVATDVPRPLLVYSKFDPARNRDIEPLAQTIAQGFAREMRQLKADAS